MAEAGRGSPGIPSPSHAFARPEGQGEPGPRHRRPTRWRGARAVLAASLAAALVFSVLQVTASVRAATPGGYTVVRNKIIGPDHLQFIPYGFVVECMSFALPVTQLCTGNDPHTNQSGQAIVQTAGTMWNANVIRFQIAQENLFSGPRGSVNPAFVSLMDGLVSQANTLGMVAIVTLQERNTTKQSGPTSSNSAFWTWMAGHYAGNPMVMFDLFNEPYGMGTFSTEAQAWDTWQNGNGTYVGMQSLVDTIRATGATNVVIAQVPGHSQDLSLIMGHLLAGSNVAYGFEPLLDSNGVADGSGNDRTRPQQYIRFGQFVPQIPLVPTAFIDYYGSAHCDPQSSVDVSQLFGYLKWLYLGVISYSLDPGEDAVNGDLSIPTSYSGWGIGPWSASMCPAHPTVHQPNTTFGPGVDVLILFLNSIKQWGGTTP